MKKLKMRLPALVLLAATLLFWGSYDRYRPDGPVLLQSPSLADAERRCGDCSEAGGHFVLDVPSAKKTASINFRLPDAQRYGQIRVRGRMKTDGVAEGKHPWRCARLLLIQYDAKNKWIPGHHGVVAGRGTSDWKECEDIFAIDPRAVNIDLVIQQTGISGTAEFDRISAEPVRLRASFAWWRLVFGAAWAFMAVLYFRRCRLGSRRLRLLVFLNAIAILAGTLMPGKWIGDAAEYAKRKIEKPAPTAPKAATVPKIVSEKKTEAPKKKVDVAVRIDQFNDAVEHAHGIGHFALFASLCFLVYLSAALERQHPVYFFKVAFDILLFAAVTEALQHLTLDRTPGILDFRKDLYGMATALPVFLAMRGGWRLVAKAPMGKAGNRA